jgi:hypothetical protein
LGSIIVYNLSEFDLIRWGEDGLLPFFLIEPVVQTANVWRFEVLMRKFTKWCSAPRRAVLAGITIAAVFFSFQRASALSVDEIASGMEAYDAQLTDLRLSYEQHWAQLDDKDQVVGEAVTSGTFGRRLRAGQGAEYFDWTRKQLDLAGNQIGDTESKLLSFDGKDTLILNKGKTDRRGYLRAWRYPRKETVDYPKPIEQPLTRVMGIEGKSWATLLRATDFTASVASSESLDGISTDKIVLNSSNGRMRITLWVAPDRSFLVLHSRIDLIDETNKESLWEDRKLGDLTQLSSGLWYPGKISSTYDPQGKIASRFEFTKIDDAPIDDKFFHPELPQGVLMIDQVNKVVYNLGPQKEILGNIGEANDQTLDKFVEAAEVQISSATAVGKQKEAYWVADGKTPLANRSKNLRWLLVGLALPCAALYLLWRKTQKSRRVGS